MAFGLVRRGGRKDTAPIFAIRMDVRKMGYYGKAKCSGGRDRRLTTGRALRLLEGGREVARLVVTTGSRESSRKWLVPSRLRAASGRA